MLGDYYALDEHSELNDFGLEGLNNRENYVDKVMVQKTDSLKMLNMSVSLSDSMYHSGQPLSANSLKFQQKKSLLDSMISFLSNAPDNFNSSEILLNEFEKITGKALGEIKDPSLLIILKSFGWTGTRYSRAQTGNLDKKQMLQALSNFYLRLQAENYVEKGEETMEKRKEDFEYMKGFSPHLLINLLNKHPESILYCDENVPYVDFMGACVLIDISGFSKFSAAMCSQGANGLDELRNATNGLLGHFVASVNEHGGDGKRVILVHHL